MIKQLVQALPQGTGIKDEALAYALVAAPVLLYYVSPNLILAALWTVVFLFVAWWRLDLGLLTVLMTAPFYRFPKELDLSFGADLLGRSLPLDISLAEYALWVSVVAWFLRRVVPPPGSEHHQSAIAPRFGWLTWAPPAALVAVATLSLPFTTYLHVALREYRVIVVEPALYYLLLVHTLQSSRDVARFLSVMVALGLGVSLFGLYHYFVIGEVEATGGVRRILAVYHSPNALALFLGRIIPVAVALAVVPLTTRRGWRPILFPAGAAIAMLLCFYLTYSRGAFIGIFAALFFLLLAMRRRTGLVVLVASCLALLLASPFLPWERLLSPVPVIQRLYVWQAGFAMALDHPLTGVGLDNFLYYYPQYMLPQAGLEPDISHPHNLLLDFWVRLGILGLAALVWLSYHFWRTGLWLLKEKVSVQERTLTLALMASMVDFLAHGLIDNSYFLIDLAYLFWMTFALLLVLARQAGASAPEAGVASA